MVLGFLVQSLKIRLICLSLSMCCAAIWLQLMGSVCGFKCPHTAFSYFFDFVCALNAYIIVLGFSDFAMCSGKHGVDRHNLYFVRHFGGRLFLINLLKIKACRYFAIRINDTLLFLDGFLRDFCLGFIQLIRLFLCFLNCFLQLRGRLLFFRKLQPRRTLTHKASPPGTAFLGLYSTMM